MATVTSVPVLLFKMRCTMDMMFFFTVKTGLCALSEESCHAKRLLHPK